ncbi:hypothetical protein CHELA40_14478 [Chelatococcus asaccharovorans]|nr:hypothetical protein CHELA17_61142 [Chelatococcus asaccharovorans]CAH1677811.1 hypothetical protein CHELA40_14478 [Chelatococcus asaccharovorans]
MPVSSWCLFPFGACFLGVPVPRGACFLWEAGLSTLWANLSGGTVIRTYHATSPLALITLPN